MEVEVREERFWARIEAEANCGGAHQIDSAGSVLIASRLFIALLPVSLLPQLTSCEEGGGICHSGLADLKAILC
jgi:hypothetical protein